MIFSRQLRRAREILACSGRLFILTGAGIGVASGIPTFRGQGGSIWKTRRLKKYAMAETFAAEPQTMLDIHEQARLLIDQSEINAAHRAIHSLCQSRRTDLFTQNVDGLHQRAGDEALELHGNIHSLRCHNSGCTYRRQLERNQRVDSYTCPACGHWLRHTVVWFDEEVQHVDAMCEALSRADTYLLVGTSGTVTSTKDIASYGKRNGKFVIEINPAWFTPATLYTNVTLRDRAESVLPLLL